MSAAYAGANGNDEGEAAMGREAVAWIVETVNLSGPLPYRWRLLSGNGRVVAHSRGYKRARDRDRIAQQVDASLALGSGMKAVRFRTGRCTRKKR